MREQVLEEPDALGIVIAVGNALVDREAEVDRLAHGDEAVLIVKRRPLLLADDAEERAGAPVRKMVVAAAQTDGAEVGEEHRGIVRIGSDEEIWTPAVAVEPADEADRRLGEKARQLVENIHAVVRGVQLLLMARGVDAAADLLVNGVHGVGRRSVKQGDRLLAAVGKFLLDDKARRDLVALVVIFVRVEAVELGAQVLTSAATMTWKKVYLNSMPSTFFFAR